MKVTIPTLGLIIYLMVGIGCQKNNIDRSPRADRLRVERIDSLFINEYKNDRFHGGVVISHHGEPIYESYFGLADRTWSIPVDQNTRFDIASVNKSMIAALVLKAVEEKRLKLDNSLVDVLSGFTYTGRFHPDITLHNLLTHTSGLADYDGVSEELRADNFILFKRLQFTNETYVDFISQIKPFSDPNTQFYYSNFAYHLLAIVLEQTYDMPFGQLLEEKLTRPLGLQHTVSVASNEVVIPNLAEAYTYEEASGQWLQNPFIDLSLGRRIFSTASDLNRWALVMDNPGWLTKESLDLIKQNHLSEIDSTFSYGYGWVIIDDQNRSRMIDLGTQQPYIVHGGRTDGYKAMLISINHGEYVISFLSNVGNRTHEVQLARKLVNLLNLN